jgi:histidyl-tRNA synthetase
VIQAPRGTFDVLPEEAARREVLEALAKRILTSAGFGRIETPAYEDTELFARGVGEATDIVQKEMYSFEDGSGRSLTLRPEGTAPVCRAYIQHGMHKLPQPVKLWYLSTFFRAEAPQRGRYREFWQIGAETIGSADPEADAELILLLDEIQRTLGVRDAVLHLSSLGTPEARTEYREELKAYLRAHEDEVSEEVRGRIDVNPLRAFDASDARTRATMADAPKLLDRVSAEDLEHFASVRRLLDEAGVAYEVDATLVRGLDYYTRTVYEFKSPSLGAQSTLGGGGRYDRLIEQLEGPATPASGWAAGVERLLLAAGDLPTFPMVTDLYVAVAEPGGSEQAFRLARAARRAGLSAQQELAGRSLKGQLKQADRLHARYVAIVGDDGTETSLRNMHSGEQRELPLGDVIATILRGNSLS